MIDITPGKGNMQEENIDVSAIDPNDNNFYINNNDDFLSEENIDIDEEKYNQNALGNAFSDLGQAKKYSKKEQTEEEKKLLGKKTYKEKKLSKGLAVNLMGKNVKAKTEPTKLQQIFNVVSKSNNYDAKNVRNAAAKINYDIDDTTIKLISDLGKAKVSVKKLGIPTGLCRKKFHLYSFYRMPGKMAIVTDDRVVWNCYYGLQFTNEKANNDMIRFSNLLLNCDLKTFSIVSDKLFKNEKVNSGYCQDEQKESAIITNGEYYKKKIDVNALNQMKAKFNDNVTLINITSPNTTRYSLYQNETNIIAFPYNGGNIDEYINYLPKVECINNKNNLVLGLKNINTDKNVGSYLNLHEIRLTDFSPSCLFISYFNDYFAFVEHELEINSVFNNISYNDIKNLRLLKVPDNFVFWDNLNSFIELIGLIKITKKPDNINNEKDDKDFVETMGIIELYNKYKAIFAAWKQIYNNFESIVLHFYDGVTNKLTIDGITKLRGKVETFLTNFDILKNHSSYNNVYKVLSTIANCKMMQNFALRTPARDVCVAILKVIRILMSGKNEELEKKNTNIEKIIRTTAIMCLECLYNGFWSMIPKVRSKVSFLGSVAGDSINDDNIKQNIENIFNLFEEEKKIDRKDIDFLKEKKQIDYLVSAALDNTIRDYNNDYLAPFIDAIKKRAMSDNVLYDSMVEDILTFRGGDYQNDKDLLAFGNFNENPDIMGFLAKANEAAKLAIKASNGENIQKVDRNKVIEAVIPRKTPNKKKVMLFKQSLGKKKTKNYNAPPLANNLKNKNVTVDAAVLRNAVLETNPSQNIEEYNKLFKSFVDKINVGEEIK